MLAHCSHLQLGRLLLTLCCSLVVVMAADRFVSQAGKDAGDCSSSNSPCLTIQYAVDRASNDENVQLSGYFKVEQPVKITQKTLHLFGQPGFGLTLPVVDCQAKSASAFTLVQTWTSLDTIEVIGCTQTAIDLYSESFGKLCNSCLGLEILYLCRVQSSR
jgi:hypothetical protein